MSSFAKTVLVLLAVLGIAISFAITLQAEQIGAVLYAGWRHDNTIRAYDIASGNLLPTFTPISLKPEGMAISPKDGLLYTVSGSGATGGRIDAYDPLTGALVRSNVVTLGKTTIGLAIDSAGDFYTANRYSPYNINKISYDGLTVIADWGSPSNYFGQDLEIRGDKLYVAHYKGFSSWPLATGGTPTIMIDTSGLSSTQRCYLTGAAFDDAGRLYTGNAEDCYADPDARSVRRWDSTYQIDNSTVLLALTYTGNYISDVEYFDGYLYAFNNKDIWRYDIAKETWSVFASGSSTYTGNTGPLAIRIPEPATLTLLSMGLFSLLWYAWRRK